MQANNDHSNSRSDEKTVARLLALVGRGAALPDSTKTAWDQTFKAELDEVVARRRRRRQLRWRVAGGCAAAVMLTVLWSRFELLTPTSDAAVAHIVTGIGNLQIDSANRAGESLPPGTPVEPGTRLQTGANSLFGLDYSGAQIRLNEHTDVRLHADAIELLSGQVYISSDDPTDLTPGREPPVARPLSVRTTLATVTDIGTQFTVRFDHGGLTSAVRDGAIKLTLASGEYTAIAGSDFAQQVAVSNTSEVAITHTTRHGATWDWTKSLAGNFAIEGRTAFDFLNWATRESGLRLVFEDRRTELKARRTILHGDISNLGPDEAIDIVLATTNLTARRPDENTLRISTLTE